MQPFWGQLLRVNGEELVRQSVAEIERIKQRQSEIICVIAQSKARVADTREILRRMDAALARLNIKL